ncbi:MAG: cell division protein FtsZ [Flavobacteriaceae bacterium]|nr:cell division protein FtsZ [Flavobacteriaceae bacterium]MDG2314091.1 cell division protein FtsZ [Flavobacteriaceae bacterium]
MIQSNSDFENLSFDLPKNQSNVIKVIGVGGGGSNAINHMYSQGINGVDFVVCNTDAQALQNSPVPNKIQLGLHLTEGMGAGANPEIGAQSAIESDQELRGMLESNTKMIFITAGMGGGTGTGAAPIIAKMAREMEILTVGIVTIPFQFEGKTRNDQAQIGVEKLRKHVDSLIVINNNKLREVYGNLGFKQGFSKADEVLATASRGIAEVITHHYTQNIDLRDAKTVLSNSGTAIMGSASAAGSSRAQEAIVKALDSPLLNDNKIAGAKNVLLLIVSGSEEITIDEIGEINEYIQNEAGHGANIIMGVGEDTSLENSIAVTVIATGFNAEQQQEIVHADPQKIIHTLNDEQSVVQDLTNNATVESAIQSPLPTEEKGITEEKITYQLEEDQETADELIPTTELLKQLPVDFEEIEIPIQKELVSEDEFVINDVTPKVVDFDVVDPETVAFETPDQFSLSFDLPLAEQQPKQTESKIVYDLEDSVNEIEVNEAIQLIPVTDIDENGTTKYSLDDYVDKQETAQMDSKAKEEQSTEKNPSKAPSKEVNPLNSTISDLAKRTAERKITLKEFNHKFYKTSRIEELEKEPAFKRAGVDLTTSSKDLTTSRTSVSVDSNEGVQLRTNNSFLHDNVD